MAIQIKLQKAADKKRVANLQEERSMEKAMDLREITLVHR